MAQIKIHRDGTLEVLSGTQDIGGGARTVVLVLASRAFGYLPFEKIQVKIGDSDFGHSGASAGSSTTGGVTQEVQQAAKAVKPKFFEAIAEKLGGDADKLEILDGGRVGVKGGDKSVSWNDACGFLKDTVMSYAPTIVEPGAQWAVVREDGKIEQATEEDYRA